MRLELLSPAGSMEALQAAIAGGADAVYLGASAHGARASVGFDDVALEKAIRFAHLYGRRIYVTVNTLLKQNELDSIRQLLKTIVRLRADAVIVQDLGLVKLIKEEFPGLCVHASTQMSVHNARGAERLLELGISRVVLARECTLSDIREVAKTGIETEVFVHGAMCVSVSGQCLFSSQIGGRSGNRGKCAQPCRLQYTYKDHRGALLSMHDMNTLEHLDEFVSAGVTSFKIEGRLKRPEYVGIVTGIYKKALADILNGQGPRPCQEDQEQLKQIFSRGFTSGHSFSDQDSLLIGPERVSHLGVKMGSILSFKPRDGYVLAQAKLSLPLHNGDGLQVRGRKEQELIYSGPDVNSGDIATLRLRQNPSAGDEVYRLADERQLEKARQDAGILPPLPYFAELSLAAGEPAFLNATSGKAQVTVKGETARPALKQPLNKETIGRLLGKTGGTPFVLDGLKINCSSPVFMLSSELNALRREALEQLEEALISAHELPKVLKAKHSFAQNCAAPGETRLYALVQTGVNRQAIKDAGADKLIFYADDYRTGRLQEQLKSLNKDDVLLLPRQMRDEDLNRILQLSSEMGLSLMADNLSQIGEGADYSGEGIHVWNNESLKTLCSYGVKACVLSHELSLSEIEALDPDILELILPVYGRPLIMLLNHCPERVRRGLSKNRAGCTFCDRGAGVRGQTMTDRMSASYTLAPTHFDKGCVISLFHHKTRNLGGLSPKMSWLVDLRNLDTEEEAVRIVSYYKALQSGQPVKDILPLDPGRALLGVE
ncbi:MAG: U32 family peptidase [Bacillota bacterium]|nr:U32 family peptidase [Bacillota bacterium]